MGSTAGAPIPLSDQVTVEVLIDSAVDPERLGVAAAADSEILETSELLGFLTGERVTLVTGDVSMRLRAAVRGLTVVAMPDTFRVPLVDQSA